VTISALAATPFQIQLLQAQVYRAGVWQNMPIQNATGTFQKGAAGNIAFTMSLDNTDPNTILFEGERVRMYGGIYGAPMQRRFTGFVDSVQTVDSVQGTVRSVTASDHIKELNDAILLEPRIYDGIEPNVAVADAINQAITSGQLKLYDDNGNALLNVNAYDVPNGNNILDAPRIFNDDLSTYLLPQGVLASTMTIQNASASIFIPPASGTNTFIELQLPFGFIVASTMSANFTLSTNANTLPPPSRSYYLDSYNGIAYFNNADASALFQFACYYYSTPLFGFQLGSKVGDVIAGIMDKTGQHLNVDPYGKFHVVSAQQPRVPKRILGKDQYIQNGIQTNRDRRNVIVCEGWDGNCGGVIAAKAVLLEDTILAPPHGLGKRAYLIVQDPAWKTQYAVNKAAYYAAQQIGRRGKVMQLTIIDDVTLQLDDTLGFLGTIPEISNGDFFVIENLSWQAGVFNNKQIAQSTISGTLLPGRSTIYIGPSPATTGSGNLDYTVDTQPIFNCFLNPNGGNTSSSFSIFNGGLHLVYTVGPYNIVEQIDIWGSDGSHTVAESGITRTASQILNLPLPSNAFRAGVFYVIQLWTVDQHGNVGAYRDCIYALP
jgi:hypothetical protein